VIGLELQKKVRNMQNEQAEHRKYSITGYEEEKLRGGAERVHHKKMSMPLSSAERSLRRLISTLLMLSPLHK